MIYTYSPSIDVFFIANSSPHVSPRPANCAFDPLASNGVCDTSLSLDARAAALVQAMTLDEKIGSLSGDFPIEQLWLPSYEWWNKGLHGVVYLPGVEFQPLGGQFSSATSSPCPINMGATFNDALVQNMSTVISAKGKSFYNFGFASLHFWTPNINPFRGPRWGRGWRRRVRIRYL